MNPSIVPTSPPNLEHIGYLAIRTGALCTFSSMDSHRRAGVRNSKNRKMNDAEWEAHVADKFEPVYRVVEG